MQVGTALPPARAQLPASTVSIAALQNSQDLKARRQWVVICLARVAFDRRPAVAHYPCPVCILPHVRGVDHGVPAGPGGKAGNQPLSRHSHIR